MVSQFQARRGARLALWALIALLCVALGSGAAHPPSLSPRAAKFSAAEKLFSAARRGRIADLNTSLQLGVDVNSANVRDGRTALHEAAQSGHVGVAHALLEAGANIDLAMARGGTALTIAASQGHIAMVELLVAREADIDIAASDGTTALDFAAMHGHVAVVRKLLASGAQTEPTRPGPSRVGVRSLPIYAAAQQGHVGVVDALLEANAAVNVNEHAGGTPIWIAAANGHADVVRALISAGADIDLARPSGGDTPLHVAAAEGHVPAVFVLLGGGASRTVAAADFSSPAEAAMDNGHVGIAHLIRFGADRLNKVPFIADADTMTAVAGGGDIDLMRVLLAWQSLVEMKRLPQELSLPSHHDGLCARFENWDIDTPDSDGVTALYAAASGDHVAIVAMLLEAGSDVTLASINEGQPRITPLQNAAALNSHRSIDVLIKAGARIDRSTLDDGTALNIAAKAGNHIVVRKLLDAGANPSTRTSRGETPRAQAAHALAKLRGTLSAKTAPTPAGACSFIYRYISRESCSQFDSLPLTSPTPADAILATQALGYYGDIVKRLDAAQAQWDAARASEEADAEDEEGDGAELDFPFDVEDDDELAERLGERGLEGFIYEGASGDIEEPTMEVQLFEAAFYGRVTRVVALLEEGVVDIEAMSDAGAATALFAAAQHGHTTVVKLLLEHGAQVDHPEGYDFRTPLFAAAEHSRLAIMGLLLDAGADATVASSSGHTPLFVAASRGNVRACEVLIRSGGADVNTPMAVTGVTPLYIAAFNGHARVVQLLLEHEGTLVDQVEAVVGKSPLMIAVEKGHVEFSFVYRYISRESCSQFDSLPLTSLTLRSSQVTWPSLSD
jgi:ankyrin repeat protein